MRKLLWVLAAAFVALVAFWAGMVSHFPGEALSRFIEAQVNRDPRVTVRIAPAELGWTSLTIPQIRVDGILQTEPAFLVALTDTEIPLSWGLWDGLPLRTRVGPAGEVELFWPWRPGEASFSARNLRLESIPALAQLPVKRLTGSAEISAELDVKPDGLPEGQVRGRIQGLEVGGADVLGQTVERTQLEQVRFQVTLGPQVRIESLDFQGDIQGSVSGSVTPNLSRLNFSNLDLQVDIGIRSEWLQQLGPFAPVAESFLDGGKLSGTVRGTPAKPLFRNVKDRS